MRLRITIYLALTLTSLLQTTDGCFLGMGNDCDKPSEPPSTAISSSNPASGGITPSASSAAPSLPSSSAQPSPPASTSSSQAPPPPTSTSSSQPPPPTSTASSSSSIPSSTAFTPSSSSTAPTSSASSTTDKSDDTSGGGTNTGAIIGSVCGFLAVIGLGFGYAFFSKSRRNQRRNNRQPDGLYNEEGFSSTDQRPSPAMAAAAAAAADDLHHYPTYQQQQQPWQEYHAPPASPSMTYGYAPHDYYTPPPPLTQSNLGYPDTAISGAYYTAPPTHYDPPHQHAPTYSAPNAYDDHDAQKQRYH